MSDPDQFPQGSETERMHGNAGSQSETENQGSSGQGFPRQQFQTLHQAVQIPLATATIPIPSLNAVYYSLFILVLDLHLATVIHILFFFFFPLDLVNQFQILYTFFVSF